MCALFLPVVQLSSISSCIAVAVQICDEILWYMLEDLPTRIEFAFSWLYLTPCPPPQVLLPAPYQTCCSLISKYITTSSACRHKNNMPCLYAYFTIAPMLICCCCVVVALCCAVLCCRITSTSSTNRFATRPISHSHFPTSTFSLWLTFCILFHFAICAVPPPQLSRHGVSLVCSDHIVALPFHLSLCPADCKLRGVWAIRNRSCIKMRDKSNRA